MTEFNIRDVSGALNPALLGATAFRSRVSEQKIAVDVGASTTKAEISRGGFSIAEIPISPEVIGSFLDARPIVATKVVTQSIAPGTAVAVGTAIDLIITSTADLPVRVVPGIHQAFTNLTMAQVNDQFAADPRVKDILRVRSKPADLTTDDVAVLTSVLQSNNVPVSNEANQTVGAAFTAIQAAFTFQS
jgi:hypothetical protein